MTRINTCENRPLREINIGEHETDLRKNESGYRSSLSQYLSAANKPFSTRVFTPEVILAMRTLRGHREDYEGLISFSGQKRKPRTEILQIYFDNQLNYQGGNQ
jgi:hypothetical protein